MSGTFNVGLILQQFLNSQQNLLDRDMRLPIFLFVQNGETYGARWVDVGMRQDRLEYAFGRS